jgi:hypothetical protein
MILEVLHEFVVPMRLGTERTHDCPVPILNKKVNDVYVYGNTKVTTTMADMKKVVEFCTCPDEKPKTSNLDFWNPFLRVHHTS